MKTCSKCSEEKALIGFYKRHNQCKQCFYLSRQKYNKSKKGRRSVLKSQMKYNKNLPQKSHFLSFWPS